MASANITITVELTDEQAWQLAQFIKRSTFDQFRANAMNDEEAYTMIAAIELVAESLREKGFAPR